MDEVWGQNGGENIFNAFAAIRSAGLWDEADILTKELLACHAEIVFLRKRNEALRSNYNKWGGDDGS